MSKQKEFVAPEINVGSIVIWQHGSSVRGEGEGQGGNLALVTEAFSNGRCRVAILASDNTQFTVPEDPVPHANDPLARRIVESDPDAGVWRECPTQLTAAEVATLRLMIADYLAKQVQKSARNQSPASTPAA